MEFKTPEFEDAVRLSDIYSLRNNKTCDSTVLDTFIWKHYYNTRIYIEGDSAALLLMKNGDEYFSAMPYCSESELQFYFCQLQEYFNTVLKRPLKIYLADEEALSALSLMDNPDYLVREETDLKDYLYDAEELRTLPGKKFQKKRNLVNKFMKEHEGHWEYRTLCCSDEFFLEEFMNKWVAVKMEDGSDNPDTLTYERDGVIDILRNCDKLTFTVGGIFIDDVLEAFAIGSYNKAEKMVVVSIEKGNSAIPGIYQAINQLFLQNSYPDAVVVNREDDMGIEGLRKAKESYHPIGYARKYLVLQNNYDNTAEETTL